MATKNIGGVEIVDQIVDGAAQFDDWDYDDQPESLGQTRTQRERGKILRGQDYLDQNPISASAAPLLDQWRDMLDVADELGEVAARLEALRETYRAVYLDFIDNAPRVYDPFRADFTDKRRPAYLVGAPKLASADQILTYRICGIEKVVEIKRGELVIPIYLTPPSFWDEKNNLVCDIPLGLNGQIDQTVMQKLADKKTSYRERVSFNDAGGVTVLYGTGQFPVPGNKVSGHKVNEELRNLAQQKALAANPDAPCPTYVIRQEMFEALAGFFLNDFVVAANDLVKDQIEAHTYQKNLLEAVTGWKPRRESDQPRKPRTPREKPADKGDSDLYD